MKLSAQGLAQFDRDGYLAFPELLAPSEVATLRAELQRVSTGTGEGRTYETQGALKVVWRLHERDGSTASPAFRALSRIPRLLEPARQLLGEEQIYIFHSKANVKTAIDGTMWAWHQDYPNWMLDGVPTDNMVTFLIMLEETTELSGCLYFIPGSHRLGIVEREATNAVPRISVPKARMLQILESSPAPVAIAGSPGTCVVFHSNMIHSSGHNLSAKDRWQVYFVYNPIANKPIVPNDPRSDWYVSQNYEALVSEPDDALQMAGAR